MFIPYSTPIALIDSGIGGLCLLKYLTRKYPTENYVYLADNEDMPYGNKTAQFLQKRLMNLINYLYENFHVKLVILACNTASASSLEYLSKNSPVKVVGLNILNLIKDKDYKILCTKLTAKRYKELNIYTCNKLAQYIEENIFNKTLLIKKVKSLLTKANIIENNIILGCTHYELISNIFKNVQPNKNFILPCFDFVNQLQITSSQTKVGDILMLSTKPSKSYIDKLWQIYKN